MVLEIETPNTKPIKIIMNKETLDLLNKLLQRAYQEGYSKGKSEVMEAEYSFEDDTPDKEEVLLELRDEMAIILM